MSKEYIPKQFTPFIYPEWGELFDELSDNQNAEILKAITKFPDYEPKDIPVWKFIKSQLQKDYENFKAKCKKRGEASRTYWGNKGEQMISNDIESLPKDNKGEPKPLTINHLPLTETETETETETKNKIPTKKEIADYCNMIAKKIDIDYFIAYYDAANWQDNSGFPINWKQKVLKFAQNYKPKEETPIQRTKKTQDEINKLREDLIKKGMQEWEADDYIEQIGQWQESESVV